MFFRKKSTQISKQLQQLDNRIDDIYKKIEHIDIMSQRHHGMMIEEFMRRNVLENPKYRDSKRLTRFEHKIFSQFGEDGIIAEIFNRIGVTNRFFVEFGVENGTETNTTRLLLNGWQGLWIEGKKEYIDEMQKSFSGYLSQNRLAILHSFITAENIENLFSQGNVPKDIDLLSIDIDRNDFHVWNSITNYRPRVVIIEYNAIFSPADHFIVPYDPNATWDGSSYFGASIDAYCQLGASKGYKLVGCSYAGVNAFFVREDLVADLFEEPFTALNHYEPARYYLYKRDGHPRKIGS